MTGVDRTDPDAAAHTYDAVIVGSGFAGIAAGVALATDGADFLILEKGDDLGGTWRENRYPGCRSEVPGHLYSFSFEPNPYWSHVYPPADEIHDYLQFVAEKYDLISRLHTDATVQSAVHDPDTGEWLLTVASAWGTLREVRTRSLVLGLGALHEPVIPEIPGLETYQGDLVHTATWNSALTVLNRRIGVVGTGASGVQLVPALTSEAEHVTVFQRTPPWILPLGDHEYPDTTVDRFERRALVMRAHRAQLRATYEARVPGPATPLPVASTVALRALAHLRSQVADPELRDRLTPHDAIGARRVLLSDDYYAAVSSPEVSLTTSPIVAADAYGVTTQDGVHHRLDMLVLATGFDPIGSYRYVEIVGEDGRMLNHEWAYDAQTYLGVTVPHYPNLFVLLGPNSLSANSSSVLMLEAQVALMMRLLGERDRRGATRVAVRPEVVPGFMAEVDRRSGVVADTRSWYTDHQRRNRGVWPGSTREYEKRVGRPELVDYIFS